MNITVYADGWMAADDKVYRAVYGRNGIGPKHREGDGISPEGTWPLRETFYRADRMIKPVTRLPLRSLTPDDAWCDVPGDSNYNKLVTLPYATVDEKLWRDDHLYDLIVVIGYNDDPIIDGKGSAIFFHVARDNFGPSTGCASTTLSDMLEILPHLGPESTLTFTYKTLRDEPVKWRYKPPQ